MKKIQFYLIAFTLTIGSLVQGQETSPQFKPYTAESTFQKLKKDHPFIKPIKPIDGALLLSKENKTYKKAGGKKLKLDIYQPQKTSKGRFPAVILVHGGGWLTGSKENQRAMAQHLSQNGFVAITVAYRLGLEAPYPAAVLDIKDAIQWSRKNARKYNIDPDRIAILGASAGAQLATLVGETADSNIYEVNPKVSDKVQAIVNIDGIVSFIHPEAAAEGKMAGIWLNGSKEDNFQNWKEASPLEYLSPESPPTLFINSTQPRFHAGRDDMIAYLKQNNIYHEQYTIPGTPHSFWLVEPWFQSTLEYTIRFLNKVFEIKTE
ncbi:esterase [Nonlabens sp. YIK11]|uniref:alpha/beta hydrolase n=1 Tax=Nonlabens sp. YIK11 TaxID=1453349 RepID=UPI0006DD05DB|nr:alpha/beta hydrolase [Nonlabens sp. YIK11]KQC32683.1 esterase [Nonlabens sp. YIK11]